MHEFMPAVGISKVRLWWKKLALQPFPRGDAFQQLRLELKVEGAVSESAAARVRRGPAKA